MNGRDRHNGFTLVELLIVIAIILLVSSVTVPTMMRSGMFGGNPSAGAARELFALLRASQVYATTHNVDAAIAYGIDAPQEAVQVVRLRCVLDESRHLPGRLDENLPAAPGEVQEGPVTGVLRPRSVRMEPGEQDEVRLVVEDQHPR